MGCTESKGSGPAKKASPPARAPQQQHVQEEPKEKDSPNNGKENGKGGAHQPADSPPLKVRSADSDDQLKKTVAQGKGLKDTLTSDENEAHNRTVAQGKGAAAGGGDNESTDPSTPAAVMMNHLPSFHAHTTEGDSTAQSPFMAQSMHSPPHVGASNMAKQKLPQNESQFSPLLGPRNGSASAGKWGQGGRKSSRMNEMALRHLMQQSPKQGRRLSSYRLRKGASGHDMLPPPAKEKETPKKKAITPVDLPIPMICLNEDIPDVPMGFGEVDLDEIRLEDSDCESEYSSSRHTRRTRLTDTRYAHSGCLLSPDLQQHEVEQHPSFAQLWKDSSYLHAEKRFDEADKSWEATIRSIEMQRDMPHCNVAVLDRLLFLAQNNHACVLHDNGQFPASEKKLQDVLQKAGALNDDILPILLHYNVALALQDQGGVQKEATERHMRAAADALVGRNGFEDVMALTAISELALTVFEQARLIESYLLAHRAKKGFVEVFGKDHEEVRLTETRLHEVFEVEQWYCDGAGADEEEVLVEKDIDEDLGAFWAESRLEGVTPKTPSASLKQMVGKELRSINGVAVTSLQHMKQLIRNHCLLVLWFEEADAGEGASSAPTAQDSLNGDLLLSQLPSLGHIPQTVSQYRGRISPSQSGSSLSRD